MCSGGEAHAAVFDHQCGGDARAAASPSRETALEDQEPPGGEARKFKDNRGQGARERPNDAREGRDATHAESMAPASVFGDRPASTDVGAIGSAEHAGSGARDEDQNGGEVLLLRASSPPSSTEHHSGAEPDSGGAHRVVSDVAGRVVVRAPPPRIRARLGTAAHFCEA